MERFVNFKLLLRFYYFIYHVVWLFQQWDYFLSLHSTHTQTRPPVTFPRTVKGMMNCLHSSVSPVWVIQNLTSINWGWALYNWILCGYFNLPLLLFTMKEEYCKTIWSCTLLTNKGWWKCSAVLIHLWATLKKHNSSQLKKFNVKWTLRFGHFKRGYKLYRY